MLKHTPLIEVHRALNAKLVDFGGWEMPLHYGSQIDEHHQVRRDAGMFDVSHMLVIDVEGESARAYLRTLLANDVDRLQAPGRALYSCMLREDGGVIDDLIVYRCAGQSYRLVVNAGTADKDLQWMQAQRDQMASPPRIIPRHDLAMIAVQGPQARQKFWLASPALRAASEPLGVFHAVAAADAFVARTGYTGEAGFEVRLGAALARQMWEALRDAGVAPAGLGARDTLRLEAGMNLYGQDMDESVTPLEAGLAWTVDLGAGRDFIGRAALESRAPVRRLCGLLLLERGVLRAHQRVHTSHGPGEITSGSFSPTLSRSIALARVPSAVTVGDDVAVDVRDRQLRARVVKYPFVRNGRALVEVAPD